MIKKITAVLLILAIGILSAACAAKDDAPDGMQLASTENEPFLLYVPESWTSNVKSGISGAYYASTEKILVTARYETIEGDMPTPDEYLDNCARIYAEQLKEFSISGREAALLGGENASRMDYRMQEDGKDYKGVQICTARDGRMISLNLYCPEERYEIISSDFDKIRAEFVLRELPTPENDAVTDKKTPDGMKIASSKNLEYRFYVPESWICSSESGKSEAYFPESGQPNVTVTSYPPNTDISPMEYFAECEPLYRENIPGYAYVGEEECTVAGRRSMRYTYTAEIDGVRLKIMQTILHYNGMIYSLTYTALEDRFDTHMEDVETMLSAFRFR